eukprot:ANDGO_06530.mRNA.1 hypothetical protein
MSQYPPPYPAVPPHQQSQQPQNQNQNQNQYAARPQQPPPAAHPMHPQIQAPSSNPYVYAGYPQPGTPQPVQPSAYPYPYPGLSTNPGAGPQNPALPTTSTIASPPTASTDSSSSSTSNVTPTATTANSSGAAATSAGSGTSGAVLSPAEQEARDAALAADLQRQFDLEEAQAQARRQSQSQLAVPFPNSGQGQPQSVGAPSGAPIPVPVPAPAGIPQSAPGINLQNPMAHGGKIAFQNFYPQAFGRNVFEPIESVMERLNAWIAVSNVSVVSMETLVVPANPVANVPFWVPTGGAGVGIGGPWYQVFRVWYRSPIGTPIVSQPPALQGPPAPHGTIEHQPTASGGGAQPQPPQASPYGGGSPYA